MSKKKRRGERRGGERRGGEERRGGVGALVIIYLRDSDTGKKEYVYQGSQEAVIFIIFTGLQRVEHSRPRSIAEQSRDVATFLQAAPLCLLPAPSPRLWE